MRKLEKYLKAVANQRRLAILKYLKKNKEASVTELADDLAMSLKATSKHVGILSAVDIIKGSQKGPYMVYVLSKEQEPVVQSILKLF